MNQQQILKPPQHQNIVPDEDDVFDGDIESLFQGPIIKLEQYEEDQPTFVNRVNRDEIDMEDIVFQIENIKFTEDLDVRQTKIRILRKNISQMLIDMKKKQQDQKIQAENYKIQKPPLRQEIIKQKNEIKKLQQVEQQVVKEAKENISKKIIQITELKIRVDILVNILQAGKTQLNRYQQWLQEIVDKFNNIGYQVEDAGIIETENKCYYKLKNNLLERQNECEERQKQIDELNEIVEKQKSQIDQVGKSLNQNYAKYVKRLNFKENLTRQILQYRNNIVAEQNSQPIKKITVGYDWFGINTLILILIFLVILFKQYY